MTIQKLTIKKFKNIECQEITLDKIDIFIGPNNAGKSSALQAIHLFVSIAQTVMLQEARKAPRKTRGKVKEFTGISTTINPDKLIYSPAADIYALRHGGKLTTKKGIDIGFVSNGEEVAMAIKAGKNKNIAVKISCSGEMWSRISSISDPFCMYVPGLAGISFNEQYKNPGVLQKAVAKGDANSVFRNVLYDLKRSEEKWDTFQKTLGNVFEGHSIELDFDHDNDEFIEAFVDDGNIKRPIDTMGTGFLQSVQILSYYERYLPDVLLLDEPDSHLHPTAQRKLINALMESVEKRDSQLIVSTHSRHLMDEMRNRANFYWAAGGAFNDIDVENNANVILENLGAADISDKLAMGKYKAVIITEDERACSKCGDKYVNSCMKTILGDWGYDVDSECMLIPYYGVKNRVAAKMIAQMLKQYAPAARIIIHADRDCNRNGYVDKIMADYQKEGIFLWFTEFYDMESYFVDAEYLHWVFGMDVIEAKKIVDRAVQAVEVKSFNRLVRYIDSLVNGNGRKGLDAFLSDHCDEKIATKMKKKQIGTPEVLEIASNAYHKDVRRFSYGKKAFEKMSTLLKKEGYDVSKMYEATSYFYDIDME